jgi:hypothetical protein
MRRRGRSVRAIGGLARTGGDMAIAGVIVPVAGLSETEEGP